MAELAGAVEETGFAGHVAHDCRNLVRTAQTVPEGLLQEAIRILAQAGAVHVVGFRNSMALASYARSVLVHVKPVVTLLPVAGMTVAEELAGLGEGDAMLAIGFRRQPPVLCEIMAVARRAGLPVVLVADDSAAATAEVATVTLRCQNVGHGMFDSYAAGISVLNYVMNAVAIEAGQAGRDRLSHIEALHTSLGSFGPEQTRRRRVRRP